MKSKNKLLLMFMSSFLLGIVACTDLDTVPDGETITSDQKKKVVEANPERLAADLAGMFSYIGLQYCYYGETSSRDDDFGYPAICLSQDLNGPDMSTPNSNYNWFTVSSTYEDRSETYANPRMRWGIFYNQNKMANDILAAIPENTDNATLKIYKGQALAVRAFDYLCLAPYFQFKYKGNEEQPCVPIVTWDLANPASNPRATVKKVYELIISDLTQAIELLQGYTRLSKSEINQSVAYGLRARANLYMENWTEAASDADMAMAGFTPYSITDVSAPSFIDASAANWMWALIIGPSNVPAAYPSWPAKLSSFSGDSYTAGVGCYKAVNKLLFDKIPATDVRKGWWVDKNLQSPNLATITWNGVTGNAVAPLQIPDVKVPFIPYTNVKFAQYKGPGSTVNAGDWCIMRVEEMILIKAEATGRLNESQGQTILQNFVRTYRDPSYSVTASGRSFIDELWFQRRVELWGEGFGMADVMRLSKNIVRYHPSAETNFPEAYKFNIAANDGWLLLRVPQIETNTNPGIPPSANNAGGTLPVSGQNANLLDGVTD
jgi:starch-binding outer membrane protein, SusD/RagB family